MNETMVTLVGNAATQVEWRESATGGAARFRLAVTARRFDREKQTWVDGATSFYTVWAARALGKNLTGSVAVGEPLLVHGRLKVRAEERQDGTRWFSADVDAVAIGHDMTRGTTAFRRVFKGEAVVADRAEMGERAGPQGEVEGAAPGEAAGDGPGSSPGWGSGSGPGSGSPGSFNGGEPVVWESVSATVSDTAPMGAQAAALG